MTDSAFDRAVAMFEGCHREDPRMVSPQEPHALVYHRRLGHWVRVLAPDAPESLRLAAACQHIRRWTVPRESFPAGLPGYKRWRSHLARFHAQQAEEILRATGYDDTVIGRVRALLIKKGLGVDAEVQVLEDAVCLTFLELELGDFASKHEDAKVVDILKKTWVKMSPTGQQRALALAPALSERLRALVSSAVA